MLPVATAVFLFFFIIKLIQASTPSSQPNVLLVIVDDLGFHDVGYQGSEITTPNIDELASQGVKLDNYYVQPTCSPSRAELLTGRFTIHTGFQGSSLFSKHGIPVRERILPQQLQRLGYMTHHIGKWHVGYHNSSYLPTNRGYHTFFGFHTGALDYYTKTKCDMFRTRQFCGYDLWQNTHVYRGNDSQVYSTHLFSQRAVDVINHHAEHYTQRPMFLTLAYQGVHSPAQAPDECLRLNDHIKDKRRRLYAGMVSCVDQGIGNVTAALRRTSMWNNTVIIFTSDNGGYLEMKASNWPLRGEKNSLYEGGIKVVSFVSSPLLPVVNMTNSNLLHVTDWFPTIVSLAGGRLADNLDGEDIWSTLRGQTGVRNDLLLHMNPRRKSKDGMVVYSAAFRSGDWKLIVGSAGSGGWSKRDGGVDKSVSDGREGRSSVWLYNLRSDPGERQNLAEGYPVLVRILLSKLQEYRGASRKSVKKFPEYKASDPRLHGNVWGPWKLRYPEIDYEKNLSVYKPTNNYRGVSLWKFISAVIG